MLKVVYLVRTVYYQDGCEHLGVHSVHARAEKAEQVAARLHEQSCRDDQSPGAWVEVRTVQP